MKPRNTLLLALILAGLGAYLYLVEMPREAAKTAAKSLISFDKSKVSKIQLSYPDRKITLEKSGDEWRLTEPLKADADQTAVSNLINSIASAEVSNSFETKDKDLGVYGLDKPTATVTLTLEDGTAVPAIKIGKKTSVGYSAYVAKGDEGKVYVTSASFRYGMDKKVKDLREKRLFTFKDDEVRKISIVRSGEKDIELVKQGDKWEIAKPGNYPADGNQVRTLLSSLRSLRATDFIDDSPEELAKYGLDKPQLIVTLFLGKDMARKSVLVGKQLGENEKQGYYAKREAKETVYSIPSYALKNLSKDVPTLRDKTVIGIDPKTVRKVVVARVDGKGFSLVKGNDDKWKLAGKVKGKPRGYLISHFADDVCTLKGSEIAADSPKDLAQYGLDRPQIKISLYGEGEKLLGTVIGTKKGTHEIYLMRQGGSTVFGARSYVFARIDKKLSDVVEEPPSKKRDEAKKKEGKDAVKEERLQ